MKAHALEVTTEQYHADPLERPSLNASVATELIQKSAKHAWQIHPRLGGKPKEQTPEMTDGTLYHALLLGSGLDRIAVLDVKDWRTNAAKDARDTAFAQGKTIIKLSDFELAMEAAEKIAKRIREFGIPLDANPEMKVAWSENTEDGEVLCRGMLDQSFVRASGEATIYELKMIRSADAKTVQRHVLDYGYDIQEAAYREALAALFPETRGRTDFVFVFCETDPPYEVRPARLTAEFLARGWAQWKRAVRTWARCLKTGVWPGYVDGIDVVDVPPWALGDAVETNR